MPLSFSETKNWSPSFQSVNKKRVHHETYRLFWGNLPLKLQKKEIFPKNVDLQISSRFSYNLKLARIIGSLQIYDPLKQSTFSPRNVPQRTLIFSHDCHFSAESALLDPDCNATTITQAYPIFSKVLDNPLKKKALKRNKTFATQLCSYIWYSFGQPNQQLSFQKCHTRNIHTGPMCESCTQANISLQNYWKTISETGDD